MTSDEQTNRGRADQNPAGEVADSDSDLGAGLGPIDSDIRSAFADLSARASNPAVAARATMPGRAPAVGPTGRFRFAAPLVVAGLLVVLVGAAALLLGGEDSQPLETGPAENDQVAESTDLIDDASDGPGGDDSASADLADTESEGSADSDSDSADAVTTNRPVEAGAEGARYRVATELVMADTSDPYLNMRWGPSAEVDLLARLPANYTGLEATGEAVEASDGGTWMQFTLLDPVELATDEPLAGLAPVGWVNAAFVEVLSSGLPIGVDELQPCSADGSFLGQGSSSQQAEAQSDWYVYALESGFVADDCLRIVITFGQGQVPYGGWIDVAADTGPATGTPPISIGSSGGFGSNVELPGLDAAPQATETGDSTFLVRQSDGSLDLVSLHPNRGGSITAFVDRGIVVLDMSVDQNTDSSGSPPPSGSGVHLTREPLFDSGAVELVGIARPFEANLGVRILDGQGSEVEAVFSGSRNWGTRRDTSYSVATDDWTQAWGQFAVRIDGLAPGDYTVELSDDSGSDEARPFRLPITIAGSGPAPLVPGDEEQAVALGLLRFAEYGGEVDSIRLADQVILVMADGAERQVRSRAELVNPEAWTFDAEDGFGGWSGPFNVLEVLSRQVGIKVTAGPIDQCASPPRDWPADFDGLRQVSIEPVGIDSCLMWSGVSLFLDEDGEVAAVALDAWGP